MPLMTTTPFFVLPSVSGWDLTTATYTGVSFSVNAQDIAPYGIAFKPDGTKMYVVGDGNDSVYSYTLSTPWSVATATFGGVTFSVGAQDTQPKDVSFKPDGTKMYVTASLNDAIFQYTLSTPWDISTATYDNTTFSIALQASDLISVSFKPDGTKMYAVGGTNYDRVYQYTLSAAWDLSTASYDNSFFSASAQDSFLAGLAFKPDGTKLFLAGGNTDTIFQYTLSTPWNVTTASYDSVSFSVGAQEGFPSGFTFRSDNGTKMYVLGPLTDTVYEYNL